MDLVGIAFEVIGGCNSDCAFCYNVWKGNSSYPRGQMNLSEIKTLFDQVLDCVPTTSIYLTGGEPLLRKDLEQIIAYFKSKRLEISVSTNGVLLDGKRTKTLVDAGISQFEVTLLSTNERIHNELSGNPAGYQKACDAIINIKKQNVRAFVGFTATRQNIRDAEDVINLSFALGADGLSFYRFLPTEKDDVHQKQFMPTMEQINDALEILDKKSGDFRMDVFLGIPIAKNQLRKPLKNIKMTSCQAGRGKFTVDYLGNLRLCEQNPNILGNLFDEDFLSMALSKEVRNFRKFAKKSGGNCPLLIVNN